MGAIWVPWRSGSTAREQTARAKARAKAPARGRTPSKKDTEKVIAVKRRALFRDLKKGKITRKEYERQLRKLR